VWQATVEVMHPLCLRVFYVLYGDLQESLWCFQCNVIAGSHLPVKLDNDLQDCKVQHLRNLMEGMKEWMDLMHSQVGAFKQSSKPLDNP